MCGIIGYVGESEALPILVEGIRLLSYRGYDSAGVAIVRNGVNGRTEGGKAHENGAIRVEKDRGRIEDLAPTWDAKALAGTTGLGHTRWATHGAPSRRNAHPQADASGDTVVVHNGILENDIALREELEKDGVRFVSDTDTVVGAHLFARAFHGDPVEAAREVARRCRGRYALAFLHRSLPGSLVALRRGSPLLVGLGRGENLLASDARAFAGRADRAVEIGEDEIAVITKTGVALYGPDGKARERAPVALKYDEASEGKGVFPHYTLKEIFEQPDRIRDLVATRLDPVHLRVRLDEIGISDADLKAITRVDLLGCGTASYAAIYGARAIEALAGVSARAVPASEYDATPEMLGRHVLAVAITQSGETADTLSALEIAAKGGARTVAIVNVRESRAARQVEGLIDIHAGREVGVASTKVYTGMLMSLFFLAMRIAMARGRDGSALEAMIPGLTSLPDAMKRALQSIEPVRDAAKEVHRAEHMLYLGRGPDHATAIEGALKMKELSYIHAEGYPAGEMKHGPIALVSWDVPTVAVIGSGEHRSRMLANVREVKARDGLVLAVAQEGDVEAAKVADLVLPVPAVDPWLAPLVHILPLQLLAYEVAKRRGCDIDQPRNLAKSVTVQ